jgi:fatty-acyl-CoA synthase
VKSAAASAIETVSRALPLLVWAEILDRLKDIIISGGEIISSLEAESVLLKHAAIQEGAVVGVPDEKWGEAPHAFVVLKADATVTRAELSDFARANMAHFTVPRCFTTVAELPKTATGKIQKYILRRGLATVALQ